MTPNQSNQITHHPLHHHPTHHASASLTRTATIRRSSAWITMWGEEESQARPAIPSSPQRKASGWSDSRNARKEDRESSWYDDESFGASTSSSEQRRPSRPARRSRKDNTQSSRGGGGGWDDSSSGGWDDFTTDNSSYEPYKYNKLSSSGGGGRGGRRNRDFDSPRGGARGRREGGRGGGDRREGGRGGDRRRDGWGIRGPGEGRRFVDRREDPRSNSARERGVKTNLKEIENAGYEHLYGIAPVLNALKANNRDFANPEEAQNDEIIELQKRLSAVDGTDWEESFSNNEDKKEIKPEAKLAPCLFVQEGTMDNAKRSFRSVSKNEASSEIISLAQQIDLNVVEVDKGVLNTLSGNRPHQGFVLRCGGREFTPLKNRSLPLPHEESMPSLWLALDEVVDPQNLGALLRSAYFLGGGPGAIEDDKSNDNGNGVGILVCSKNSSPLTPTVSAASAGALEFMKIYSTSNLPKLLNKAREDGWRVLGAAADDSGSRDSYKLGNLEKGVQGNAWDLDDEVDDDQDLDITEYATPSMQEDNDQKYYNLNEVENNEPTVLVLGSEGRGLRTLVARACSGFVKIPGGLNIDSNTQAGVDSLNVSVSGGIFLFHFCNNKN
eukprot:scaffold67690_cov55-Cyclotella_meneghiniana.AAC.6